MNGYEIESNIIKHEDKFLNIVIVYKDGVMVSSARTDITAIIEEEIKSRAV